MTSHDQINNEIAGIRLRAHQALLQVLYRSWGAPAAEVMKNLRDAKEKIISDSLPKPIADLQIQWIELEFGIMITSLQAKIDDK